MRMTSPTTPPRRFTNEEISSLREENRVTPPWLLFYLRELRESGDPAEAFRRLPEVLPPGMACPSVVECVAVLAINKLV